MDYLPIERLSLLFSYVFDKIKTRKKRWLQMDGNYEGA